MMRFLLVLSIVFCCLSPVMAQDEEEKKLGWTNVADVGLVVTSGNSSASTFTLDDKLTYAWTNADFNFRAGALRINTTDDPFAVGTTDDFDVIEDLSRELDTERYYAAGSYQRNITDRFFWIGGAGWDKDTNAGIENRTTLFGGVGNTWKETGQTLFKTDYTVTLTRRVDVIPDPERDENFSELRLAWDFRQQLTSNSSFESDMIFFAVVSDLSDNRFTTVNAITTKLTDVLALRFSVDLRFQNVPAFEEIDLQSPEGLPTGVVVVRKHQLDTIWKFSLVVTL